MNRTDALTFSVSKKSNCLRRMERHDGWKLLLCQVQTARADRGGTGVADEWAQLAGEAVTQPAGCCSNGSCVSLRSSLPRHQSLKQPFKRASGRHEDLIGQNRILHVLDDSSHS
jgi:hypothetical protein